MEEIQLKVEKAYPIDLGRGIIRLDPTALLKLQLSPGDIVEIMGKKKTTAKVWRADRQDWEQGFARIDNFIRQNAGVSIGERISIKKVKAPEAKKLVLAIPESMIQGETKFQIGEPENAAIKNRILKRPVFRGDIIPIINSMSQPITESLTTSQVIPMVAVATEPSDIIVQVSEETEVLFKEVKSEVVQNSDLGSKKNYSNKKSLKQFLQLSENEKYDTGIDLRTLSENIVKTKDHYDKILRNIKEFNTKYDVDDSITLSILENVVTKSDKTVYEYMYNLKLQEAFNYINELESKLEIYHRVALSEMAHRKIKEIEFQINSLLFFSKSRKNYRKLVNELAELDNNGIKATKDINEFTLTSEQIIRKIQEAEDDLEDEKRTGIYHTVSNYFIVGISILLSVYQLIAAKYLNVDPYLPIIICFFLFIVIYLLLKLATDIKILWSVYTLKQIGFKFMCIVFLGMFVYISPFTGNIKQYSSIFTLASIDFTLFGLPYYIMASALIFFLVFWKDSVKKAKFELIKEEIDALIKRYELDL